MRLPLLLAFAWLALPASAAGQSPVPFPFTDSIPFLAATDSTGGIPTHTAPRGGSKSATQRRNEIIYEKFGRVKAFCQVPELDGSAVHDTLLHVELFQETGGWQRGQSPPGTDIRWRNLRQFYLGELIGDSVRFKADTAQASTVKIRCTFY